MKQHKAISLIARILTAPVVFGALILFVHLKSTVFQLVLLSVVFLILCAYIFMMRISHKVSISILAVSTLLAGMLGLSFYCTYKQLWKAEYNAPQVSRPGLFENQSVMIISPHQDDESNLLAGLIEQYAPFNSLKVVYVTNSDNYMDGTIRMKEALGALHAYGITDENIVFLGYGDKWDTQYGHIYNAPGDEVVKSVAGKTHTYGCAGHPAYDDCDYTRNNLLNDIKSVIDEYQPDTIFCIDCDNHPDHKATSMLFEEAMGQILGEGTGYEPKIYKSFAYSIGYHGLDDYYAINMKSTLNPYDTPYMQEVNIYNWADRVRFPMAVSSLGRTIGASSSYGPAVYYTSQEMAKYLPGVINADKVFWERDTRGLLYTANIEASSGDASVLNDFKLIDTKDVMNFDLTGNVWTPDPGDSDKSAYVEFPQPQSLCEIRLYDSPSLAENVLGATITFSDGSTIDTGALMPNGSATSVAFDRKDSITGFTVTLSNYEGAAYGLTEIEAYSETDRALEFIKLQNADGDFAYDYWINGSGSEAFSIYEYPAQAGGDIAQDYEVSVDGPEGCTAEINGDKILVHCPRYKSCIVKVTSKADPTIYDEMRVSNTSGLRRLWTRLHQAIALEKHYKDYMPAGQMEYYRNLWNTVKGWIG